MRYYSYLEEQENEHKQLKEAYYLLLKQHEELKKQYTQLANEYTSYMRQNPIK